MIRNERQYKITKAEAQQFEVELRRRESAPAHSDLHPLLIRAELDGLKSQLDDLQQELTDYETLRSGQGIVDEVTSV